MKINELLSIAYEGILGDSEETYVLSSIAIKVMDEIIDKDTSDYIRLPYPYTGYPGEKYTKGSFSSTIYSGSKDREIECIDTEFNWSNNLGDFDPHREEPVVFNDETISEIEKDAKMLVDMFKKNISSSDIPQSVKTGKLEFEIISPSNYGDRSLNEVRGKKAPAGIIIRLRF